MSAPPYEANQNASYGRQDVMMDRFRAIAARYEISDYFAQKLKQLEGFEIVLILDDSGSMNTPLAQQTGGPFTKSFTRWDELKGTVSIIVDLAAVMDPDGLDLYFLNRATMLGVTSSDQLNNVFASPPSGPTPISPVLRHVLKEKQAIALERKLLIIIATDGAPTDSRGEVATAELKRILVKERDPKRIFVTFLACTDDDSTMDYLNKWDSDIPSVDVVDDYASEKKEILKAQGKNFNFSFGNYVVKTLLGSVDPEFDALDEKACCTIL